jgi:hypothetical protein
MQKDLTKSKRETKLLQERKKGMAARIETELKIIRAQVTAPTPPPTVKQPTPMAPEVQSATEAPVDNAFISVLNEPLDAQNPLDNIFQQIPNSGEQGRIPTPAKRRSMLPHYYRGHFRRLILAHVWQSMCTSLE